MQFYDATVFKNKPAQISGNCKTIDGLYPYPHIFSLQYSTEDSRRLAPADEATVKAAAAVCKSGMIWLDIEEWRVDLESEWDPIKEFSETQYSLDRWKQVVGWVRQAAPAGTSIGAYGCFGGVFRQNYMFPWSLKDGPAKDMYNLYRVTHDFDAKNGTTLQTGLANVVDFWAGSAYPDPKNPLDTPDQYLRGLQETYWRVKATGKPWIPFLYVNNWEAQGKAYTIPAAKWCHNKGIVPGLWGGEDTVFDPKASWLEVLRS